VLKDNRHGQKEETLKAMIFNMSEIAAVTRVQGKKSQREGRGTVLLQG